MFCTEPLTRGRLSVLPLAVVALVLLAAAEGGLRLYGFGTPLLYAQDPDVGYYPKPQQRVRYPGRTITVNNHGMRSPDLSSHKTPGHVRILMLGDSTLAGTYVSNDELYSSLLGQKLNAAAGAPVFEVMNMGVNAWGPLHELAFVRKFGTFEADLAIICGPLYDAYRPRYELESLPFYPAPRSPRFAIEQILYELGWRFRAARLGPPWWADSPAQAERGLAAYVELAEHLRQHDVEVLFEMLPSASETLGRETDIRGHQLMTELAPRLDKLGVPADYPGAIFKDVKPTSKLYHDGVHFDRLGHRLYAEYLVERLLQNSPRVKKALAEQAALNGALTERCPPGPGRKEVLAEKSAQPALQDEIFSWLGNPMIILGVSALYHDSAAAIVRDGQIVAAAQEERFTRKKHDSRVPVNAIRYCLEAAGIGRGGQVDAVAFYDKPITKFTRLLTTFCETAPSGFKSFVMGVPAWVKEKGWVSLTIEKVLRRGGVGAGRFYFPEHHASHAGSAFFPSPFEEAAILTADGVGEWTCSSVSVGEGNQMRMLTEQRFPHSPGLLYSAFTYFTGFKVNSGEYKLMGLAPYGAPKYVDDIKRHLLQIREDGSIWLNMDYFGYLDGLTMTNEKFNRLFGGPPRRPESEISQREMDLAASIQVVTEEIMLKMARYARAVTGKRHLCMAGGVALNCVANGKILAEGLFDDFWIQPASGDAGGAVGSGPVCVAPGVGQRPAKSFPAKTRCRARRSVRATRGSRSRRSWTTTRFPTPKGAARPGKPSWPRCWPKSGSWACARAEWNSARARWATGPSSPMPGARRCNPT